MAESTATRRSCEQRAAARAGVTLARWCVVALCATAITSCSWLRNLTSPLDSQQNASARGPVAPANISVAALALGFKPDLLAKGYTPQIRDNTQVYCRIEVPTGSKISRKTCFTEQQLADNAQAARDLLGTAEKNYGRGSWRDAADGRARRQDR
jgi:hypothetical protein